MVECFPLDPAAQVRLPPWAVGIFLHLRDIYQLAGGPLRVHLPPGKGYTGKYFTVDLHLLLSMSISPCWRVYNKTIYYYCGCVYHRAVGCKPWYCWSASNSVVYNPAGGCTINCFNIVGCLPSSLRLYNKTLYCWSVSTLVAVIFLSWRLFNAAFYCWSISTFVHVLITRLEAVK